MAALFTSPRVTEQRRHRYEIALVNSLGEVMDLRRIDDRDGR
jgi:hypothetical protein